MKAQRAEAGQDTGSPTAPRQTFSQVLKSRRADGVPGGGVAGQGAVQGALAGQEARSRALGRVKVEAEALALVEARGSHSREVHALEAARSHRGEEASETAVQRLLQLVLRDLEVERQGAERSPELLREVRPPPVSVVSPGVASSTGTAPDPSAARQVAVQAMALVERVELFLRSARPALALTLNNSLGARVEIERTGARQVAVTLTGVNGPPSPDAVTRLRDALRARGLQVASLSVA